MRFVDTLPPGGYDVAFADPPSALALATRHAERWLEAPFASILAFVDPGLAKDADCEALVAAAKSLTPATAGTAPVRAAAAP